MAFEFAYSLAGAKTTPVVDVALDTVTNYKNSVGTNGPTKGDLVFLDGTSGLAKRVVDAATPKADGVLEGTEFTGLVAAGQPYAATNSSFTASATDTTKYPNGVGKIRSDVNAVYRVPVASGQDASTAVIGKKYGIVQDTAGDQTVDLTEVTNTIVKVRDYDADKNVVFVTIASN